MRNLYSCVNPVSSFVTCSGDPVHILYEPRFNGSSLTVVAVGRENIQERIESFAPFTDLNYMLSRLKVGDSSVLNSKRAMYGDFSNLPHNPIEAVNYVHFAESNFAKLSNSEKLKFNNDWRVWFSSLISSQFSGSDFGSSDSSSSDSSTSSDSDK